MESLLNSRVAFSLFGVDIYWYGVFITLGILSAFIIAFFLCKKKSLNEDLPYYILLAVVPIGILSARLFSVIFEEGLTLKDYFDFRSGGMSIIGAVLGGAIGLTILCLIKKINFFELADVLVVVLILAQAIGRWGNYFNNELYGQEITNEAWQFFPFAVKINGTFYEALFFYESMLNLLGFAGLICLFWFTKDKGICTGTYLTYYGIVRFFLEPRRQTEFILKVGSVQISRLLSLFMIIVGIIILIYVICKKYSNQNKRNKVNEK